MKEIPILFSTPMVLALIEGRKTMTRRMVKGTPLKWLDDFTSEYVAMPENGLCPYGKPGDLLWVREGFSEPVVHDGCEPDYYFKADNNIRTTGYKWKPSIHMPKVAARIWLGVTDVKVERLQQISKEEAIAEGILHDEIGFKDYDMERAKGYGHPDYDYPHVQDARISFQSLWRSINGWESWNINPWVWCVSFKVLSTTGKPQLKV